MPGIVAVIDDEVDNSLIRIMAESITHEEWQRSDLFWKPPLAIARVHLGIMNAEPQPIFNEDESACIVMYGEVVDYEEEKIKLKLKGHKFKVENDPEYCLHLFEEYGESFVEKLNGSFVLVIYDIKNNKVLIANDRHGLRPFYYAENEGRYLFSSEVKAILKDATFKKEINHEAVADFFAFGRILGNKTLFEQIKLMSPGTIMIWSNGESSQRKYWDFNFLEKSDPPLSEEYYANKLVELLRKAVERRTRRTNRIGVFLSGGLDSRTIAATIMDELHHLQTFTYGVKGGDEQTIARKVAERLGTKHEFMEIKSDYLVYWAQKGVYLTDGMLNCANFWWIDFLSEVRKTTDLMFHGTALDTLLSSQWYGTKARELSKLSEETFVRAFYNMANYLVPTEMMPHLFSETYYRKIKQYPLKSFENHLKNIKEKDPINRADSFFLKTVGRYYLSIVILRNYIEDEAPGLDNDFFEFVLRVPQEMRTRFQRLYFRVLSTISPEVSKIPYQRTGVAPAVPILVHRISFLLKGGYKYLARKLRTRTRGIISFPTAKIGYPDIDTDIRKNRNLRSFFESILLDQRTLSRKYFNPDFLTQMVRDHMTGKKDYALQLSALVTFELWHRLFVDTS